MINKFVDFSIFHYFLSHQIKEEQTKITNRTVRLWTMRTQNCREDCAYEPYTLDITNSASADGHHSETLLPKELELNVVFGTDENCSLL